MNWSNYNHWIARLYRWYYDKSKGEMPKSICPYFWQVVWMFITIIPVNIFCIPIHIGYLIEDGRLAHPHGEQSVGKSIGMYILLGFALGILFCVISSIALLFGTSIWGWEVVDSIFFLSILGAFVIWGIAYYFVERRNERRYEREDAEDEEKTPSMLVTWWKANKQKICPPINWK